MLPTIRSAAMEVDDLQNSWRREDNTEQVRGNLSFLNNPFSPGISKKSRHKCHTVHGGGSMMRYSRSFMW
ncbi:hypothetical protein PM082_006980 [Marasmius tenuissimus]|nr:hypothetical protein PM082_006980 [Marasmius tenuissimus]